MADQWDGPWHTGDRVALSGTIIGTSTVNRHMLVQVNGSHTAIWVNVAEFVDATMDSDDPRGALHDDWHGGG